MKHTYLSNYHTHCYLCDGAGAPIDYAAAALQKGFDALGFSSHAPLPFPVDWVMEEQNLSTYIEEIDRAAKSVPLPIHTGMEIDFVPDVIGPDRSFFPELSLDFVIGSVHFVQALDTNEQMTVDGPIEEFRDTLDRGFGGNAKAVVRAYFENLRSMLDGYTPEIVGHIDVIRKNNPSKRFFDETESWYKLEVLSALDRVKESIVEINTGALARGHDALYPEYWIVEECKKRNIRMMVNTDAHSPEHLGFGYDRAFAMLSAAGFTEYWALTKDGWRSFPLAG